MVSKETKSRNARTVNNKKRTNSLNKKAIIVSIFLTIIGVFTAIYLYQYTHASKLEKQLLDKQSVIEQKTNELNSKAEQLNLTDQQKQELQKQVDELNKIKSDLERQLQAKKEQASKVAVVAPKQAQASSVAVTGGNCTTLSSQLGALGINGAELNAAIILATRESSCRDSAVNASSGACGAFQSYPCGKWGQPGTTQYLQGAISYVKGRYGSFQAALAHSYAKNWY